MPIKVENLSFTYSPKTPFETAALREVNLTVETGEFFGIIGHTGSGKSTLVQHFNGLIKPQSGKVTVLGIDVSEKRTLKELRSKVGMVFQYPEYQLFAETVEADVAFGLKNFFGGKHSPLTPEKIENSVKEAIELVGLDYEYVRKRSPFDLSGGQRRRVAIAGVIVTKPKILILDEPTAGLDPKGKREIMALLHSLKRECSPTVVMIGHDMDEMAENCSRICVLEEGRIAYVLPPARLFTLADELVRLKLDLPETVKIARRLRECGIDTPPGLFTPEALAPAIAEHFKTGRQDQ